MTNAPANLNVGQILAASPVAATGGLYRAPLGTTLPTDTTTAIAAPFNGLGYVDEDGVTLAIDRPNTPAYAWGGLKVAALQQHFNPSLSFKLMQVLDPDNMKAVFSDSNVTVTAATVSSGTITTVAINGLLNVNSTWVVSGFYQSETFRIAVPNARVTSTRDIKFTHKALAMYDCTLEMFPDSSGNSMYYITDDGVFAA